MTRKADGDRMAIGFSSPGEYLGAGKAIGFEAAVCDDDGSGRESLLIWTENQGSFWFDMNGWGELRLE